MTVLTPCDAVSAYALVLEMAEWPSACFLRALRADTALIYAETETFPFWEVQGGAEGDGQGEEADDLCDWVFDSHDSEGDAAV